MLQYVAVLRSVLQCVSILTLHFWISLDFRCVLQCVAVYCSVLQCIAVCCSVCQCRCGILEPSQPSFLKISSLLDLV